MTAIDKSELYVNINTTLQKLSKQLNYINKLFFIQRATGWRFSDIQNKNFRYEIKYNHFVIFTTISKKTNIHIKQPVHLNLFENFKTLLSDCTYSQMPSYSTYIREYSKHFYPYFYSEKKQLKSHALRYARIFELTEMGYQFSQIKKLIGHEKDYTLKHYQNNKKIYKL